jgi:energy-coupling factor transporter ATP-binding protein EcfA2
VTLAGRDTTTTPPAVLAERAGLLLQNPLHQLLAESVEDELRLGLRHVARGEAEARLAKALEMFGLGAYRHRHPLALSEGQRRRVALAAVLVRRPSVLVMDEPTLGQDERGRAALVEVTHALRAGGVAVLAISHDPEFVNDACDRVLVLRAGRLVADVDLSEGLAGSEHLAAAGAPLADVPATAALLVHAGLPLTARVRSPADLVVQIDSWRGAAREAGEAGAANPPPKG